jgi:O-antigen/teichoic acid export membrane protein
MENYMQKAVQGTVITFSGIMLAAVFSYLLRIVLARGLTPAEYGLFFAVFTFVAFFELFRDWGLNSSLVKFIPVFKVHEEYIKIKSSIKSVFLVQIISSTVIVLLLVLSAGFLSNYYFKNPQAEFILQVISLMFIFHVFDDIVKKVFQGFGNMKCFSVMELSRNALTLILVLLFFSLGLNIMAPAYAYALASPLIFAVSFFVLMKTYPFLKRKAEYSFPLIKKLISFGIPSTAATIGEKIILYSDVLILTYFVTLDEVGVYNVVLPTAILILYLSRAIALVMVPLSSELWEKKEYAKLSDGARKLHTYSFACVTPLAFSLIAFSALYLKTFFGEAYASGALALQVIMAGTIFFTVNKINHSLLLGIDKPKISAKITLTVAACNILLNFVLIPSLGIMGAAIATTISYLLALLLSDRAIAKHLKVKLPLWNMTKVVTAGIMFTGILIGVKELLSLHHFFEVILGLGIAGIVYAGLLIFFKVVCVQEVKELVQGILTKTKQRP